MMWLNQRRRGPLMVASDILSKKVPAVTEVLRPHPAHIQRWRAISCQGLSP